MHLIACFTINTCVILPQHSWWQCHSSDFWGHSYWKSSWLLSFSHSLLPKPHPCCPHSLEYLLVSTLKIYTEFNYFSHFNELLSPLRLKWCNLKWSPWFSPCSVTVYFPHRGQIVQWLHASLVFKTLQWPRFSPNELQGSSYDLQGIPWLPTPLPHRYTHFRCSPCIIKFILNLYVSDSRIFKI